VHNSRREKQRPSFPRDRWVRKECRSKRLRRPYKRKGRKSNHKRGSDPTSHKDFPSRTDMPMLRGKRLNHPLLMRQQVCRRQRGRSIDVVKKAERSDHLRKKPKRSEQIKRRQRLTSVRIVAPAMPAPKERDTVRNLTRARGPH